MAFFRCSSGGGGGSDYYNNLKISGFYSTNSSLTKIINLDDRVFVAAAQAASAENAAGTAATEYTELFEGDDITLQYSRGSNTYKIKFQRSGTTVTATKVTSSGSGFIAIFSHVDPQGA